MASQGAAGDLFQRKATGLLRGWSVRDAFIYAAFSINLITLGLFIFSYAPFIPEGSLILAVLLSGFYLVFQAVTYASLIAVMPRAGGDYVWQSRILGGGIGFVLAVTGWWFILWHWVPIYANILNVEVVAPVAYILGANGVAEFFNGSGGLFAASMFVAVFASVLISLGMRTYAKIQKFCFYVGLVGLALMLVLLAVHSNADFVAAFNEKAQAMFGVDDAYERTLQAGGAEFPAAAAFYPTLLLIPMVVFFNLWSNWGATLYGEVRGASDFRKNIYAMGGALISTTVVAAIMLLLFARTFGWDFYYAANNAYWAGEGVIPAWPYPGLLAAFFFDSPVLQLLLVGLLSLWFFGWCGTVFLSSTRVVFATAFDRVLPEAVSRTSRNGVPYVALLLMFIPSIPISYFYAFGEEFATWTLNATLVIATTFLGSAIAAAVLPWRRPDIYNASPISRYTVFGIPLVTVAAVMFAIFLLFCLYQWISRDVYGINNEASFIYLGILYGIAIVGYIAFRIIRRLQGIDLKMVYGEIPEE
ncbi:APC family permease [Rubrobacter taiwanensis]|jgi:APA family basic amino acid/polyamine antiporter|uniref:APC family permease n=1 Tax=Rubrobacter taiwanensis TaxID=185139 RepID=A0A4R1BQV8_9ACTN|nr:APC family permease [Rubrobacter taiwanensis]TCJ20090.1 APC family permease [Rubrobacter taiwanensis]